MAEIQGFHIRRGDGIVGQVWETGTHEFVKDLSTDPRYPYPHFAITHGLRSGLFLPLTYNDVCLGTLGIYGEDSSVFDANAMEFLVRFGSQAALVLSSLDLTKSFLRQQALEITTKVAAGSATSMRNPLTAIRGWTQLLQSQFSDNELGNTTVNPGVQISDFLANIVSATSDLEGLINDLKSRDGRLGNKLCKCGFI